MIKPVEMSKDGQMAIVGQLQIYIKSFDILKS